MLQTLSIKQFAIIEELEIQFSDGLTVLSGETGSGKSIIIDAIGQLIGMRASSDFVRHGEKRLSSKVYLILTRVKMLYIYWKIWILM